MSTNIVAEERPQLLSSFLCTVFTKTQQQQVLAYSTNKAHKPIK